MWQVRDGEAGPFKPLLSDHADSAGLDARVAGVLARRAVADMAKGIAYGTKAVLQPSDDELLPLVGQSLADMCPPEERLNWKLNALVSANARYCAVKIVGSNALNKALGRARSQSLIILYDKLSMRPLAMFDGTMISARRTGAYASMVVDAALMHRPAISLCLHGTGPIADCVVDDLRAHHPDRIQRILVRSRRQENAERFAAAAARRTGLDVRAAASVDDTSVDMIITATNAAAPIIPAEALAGDIVVLHLGGDELPAAFIERALGDGSVICDDVSSVCHRNSQSLALFFSRQGQRLRDLASAFHVRSLHDVMSGTCMLRRPVLVTCVGLPVLDLYLTQWVYEQQTTLGSEAEGLVADVPAGHDHARPPATPA